MDEFGARLIAINDRENSFSDKVGKLLVNALPYVIRGLSIIGTIALMLVSGGIFVHNVHIFHDFIPTLPMIIKEFVVGLIAGALTLAVVSGMKYLWNSIKNKSN